MKVKKSIKFNVVMNSIKTMMAILFPLISFPYVSRVLGTIGIGKVNYVVSIVNYFVLVSTLGIPTYAIREGGKFRDNDQKLGKFVTELFLINIISTVIAILAFVLLFFIPSLKSYRGLLLIVGTMIPFTTLGMSWVYQIIEDYTRITVQTVIFQALSLVLLLTFVKTERDYYIYAAVYVFASVGSNFLFFIHTIKHIKLFGYKHYTLKIHIKPIIIIFGMTIASTIYLNMDTTMLGAIRGDNDAGIYTAASKLVNIICNLISSMSGVILARLSYYVSNGEDEKYNRLIKQTARSILCLAIPACVGLGVLSKELLILLSGNGFVAGDITMKILCLKVILSPINGFLAYQVLMPIGKEKVSMWATIIGCIINLILNSLLIRNFTYVGAAIATVFAELSVTIVCIGYGRRDQDLLLLFKGGWKYLFGSLLIIPIGIVCNGLISNMWAKCGVVIILSILVYATVLFITKEELIYGFIKKKTE